MTGVPMIATFRMSHISLSMQPSAYLMSSVPSFLSGLLIGFMFSNSFCGQSHRDMRGSTASYSRERASRSASFPPSTCRLVSSIRIVIGRRIKRGSFIIRSSRSELVRLSLFSRYCFALGLRHENNSSMVTIDANS